MPLAQIATVLRHAGIESCVVDAPVEGLTPGRFAAMLSPRDLVFCMVSPLSVGIDLPFLRWIRGRSGARTAVFGAYPTFQPGEAIVSEGVDFLIRGEPEEGARQLALLLARGGHPSETPLSGIGWRIGDRTGIPGNEAPRPDLDSLPFPDRKLLPPPERYFNPVVRNTRFTTAFTSRGCFGKCTFCTSARFHGGNARYRSAERVLEELRGIRKSGIREVFFRDELFTGDRKRLEVLCREIPRQVPDLRWVCSTRVDLVSREVARMMREAGCHLIRMGVESGSQQILDRIRKGITVAQTAAAFEACRAAGLDTHAHAMIGLPGETRDQFGETLRLLREIRPSYLTVSVCTPLHGTLLHESLGGESVPLPDGGSAPSLRAGFHSAPAGGCRLSGMTDGEIALGLRQAYTGFYFRWEYLLRQTRSATSPRSLLRKVRAGTRIAAMAWGKR
ncbi:MAG TPA: radical SAM protein [Candidatus Deferrimicrobiaceae bacterium]